MVYLGDQTIYKCDFDEVGDSLVQEDMVELQYMKCKQKGPCECVTQNPPPPKKSNLKNSWSNV